MRKARTMIALFSGAGGMDLGFKNSGFDNLWACDFNKDAVNTYEQNIGNHITLADITTIESSEIPAEPYELDLIIGGFPCQGFSIANKNRSMEDQRNFLYLEMLRIINDKKPKYFVAENVKGLISMQNGEVIKMIVEDFKKIGYKVDYKILNAADYGVPQARERVIIIGNRIGVENKFPIPTHRTKTNELSLFENEDDLPFHITVEEAIGHLANVEIQNGKTNEYILVKGVKIYNHIASTTVHDTFFGRKYEVNQADICDYLKYWRDRSGWTTKKVDEHFGYKYTAGHWFRKDNKSGSIPKPTDWWELKKILGFDNKYDKIVTTFIEKDIKFEQSLRITNWDRPSDTITATSPEIHVNKERRLSVRECAILQTFPNDFIFTGSLNSMYRQIGNAVPVKLAEQIGDVILKQIELAETKEKVVIGI